MSQPISRHIRVFISSTFRDMAAERDQLVKFIFPQLRRLCEDRGVVWGEVDLRWGITDEQSAEGQVLPLTGTGFGMRCSACQKEHTIRKGNFTEAVDLPNT